MAATNYTPIQLYYSATAAAVPVNTNLVAGELAINTADGKLFYKDSAGVVQTLATKGAGTIGGSTTQVQYNNSGALAGSSNLTFNGTTLTANDFTDSSLTSGRVTYAGTGGNLIDSANLTFNGTTLTAAGLAGPFNGTVGATTANTGAFTTLSASSTITFSGGTANGVAYLNGSKVLTTGSGLVFDGSNLGVGVTPSAWDTNSRAIQLRNSGGLYDLSFGGVSTYTFLSNNSYRSASGVDRYLNNYPASNYLQNNGIHSWSTAPSGTAGNAITFTQAMTLNTNGVLALQGASTTATGVGITFPATQSASSDANTLDDYEEGSWTPNQGSGLTVVGTFSSSGLYTKIGRQVTIHGSLNATTSVSSASAALMCTNLPFASTVAYMGGIVNNSINATGICVVSGVNLFSATVMSATTALVFSATYTV